jgi:hypothetical protein
MKKYLPLIILVLFGVALTIANIPVELHEELKGKFEVSGKIDSCEFSSLNENSSQFFVGIKVVDDNVPVLRINPYKSERSVFEDLCERKIAIQVTYHAKKRLYGPVRYWIDTIKKTSSYDPTSINPLG